MTVEIKDILLKAAEDVQSGMWCKGSWFRDAETGDEVGEHAFFADYISVDEATAMHRCAQGSMAVATKLLGGRATDYLRAVDVVDNVVLDRGDGGLIHYNDDLLPDDPFEAGQQLAELFRSTAESL